MPGTQPSLLDIMSRSAGFGEAPQQAFFRACRGRKNRKGYTLSLLAGSANSLMSAFVTFMLKLLTIGQKQTIIIVI